MKKGKYRYKRKPTGENDLFERIWVDRLHCSGISGRPITNWEANHRICFAHILSKNKYPLFRLYEPNIILLTHDEHNFWDNRTEKELKERIAKGIEDWEYLIQLEQELILEYKKALLEWHTHGCFPEGSKFFHLNLER